MTNRDKQLIEAAIVQQSPLIKAEKIVTLRYGENELKYSWDEQNGYKFEWSIFIPEKWYIDVCPSFYWLYRERNKEVTEYKASYRIDPKTLQPILYVESFPLVYPKNDNWKNEKRSYTPNDQELQAISKIESNPSK